jgi:hypothetical protein
MAAVKWLFDIFLPFCVLLELFLCGMMLSALNCRSADCHLAAFDPCRLSVTGLTYHVASIVKRHPSANGFGAHMPFWS